VLFRSHNRSMVLLQSDSPSASPDSQQVHFEATGAKPLDTPVVRTHRDVGPALSPNCGG
jgi:hypothetical protein